jgi:hypothetical protein
MWSHVGGKVVQHTGQIERSANETFLAKLINKETFKNGSDAELN